MVDPYLVHQWALNNILLSVKDMIEKLRISDDKGFQLTKKPVNGQFLKLSCLVRLGRNLILTLVTKFLLHAPGTKV